MVSTFTRDYGKELLADGRISPRRIDDAVSRILRVKFRAGLFENPYVDPAKAQAAQLLPDAVAAARTAAGRSMVLLKNEGELLPLDPARSTVVIGPLANNDHDMLGPWPGRGVDGDAVAVFDGIKAQNPLTTYVEACSIADKEPPNNSPLEECGTDAGFAEAVAVARAADQVVLALGESRGQSGEAAARTEIDLPGLQEQLIAQIAATGKPFVVVLFGGVNPGGKLPVSFPRNVGQVPIYYNHEPTGRPCDVTSKYNSRYRDLTECGPQYDFGFGLSYTTFDISNLRLSSPNVSKKDTITASVDVTNTGAREGDEVVQLYINDPVASISQPVRRLRGFERVTLAPGATTTVTFTLGADDFGFYDEQFHR